MASFKRLIILTAHNTLNWLQIYQPLEGALLKLKQQTMNKLQASQLYRHMNLCFILFRDLGVSLLKKKFQSKLSVLLIELVIVGFPENFNKWSNETLNEI